eukprot:CAMPEP_0113535852 /NCGR_PEP_ID=MMETSP0015_2-20120614/5938_1 /TAXON_ID=2838 /ORGANISM="Odontella" /LENGTH=194 /DNA_ID=CAMNT_0000435157 /DNA_START=317 /DNA_END=898 /DNA_ORIENTATION=- /assembly_acc=CAM_ASM_000160
MSLEMAHGWFKLKESASMSEDAASKKYYSRFFAVYCAACVQSLLTLLSHSSIGVNPKLEAVLLLLDQRIIQTSIFGTGLVSAFGSAAFLPVFWAVTAGKLSFGNWAGRLLASFTVYSYGSKRQVPKFYCWAYLSVPLLQVLLRNIFEGVITDFAHAVSAVVLIVPLGLMTFLPKKKYTEQMDEKEPALRTQITS